MSVEHAPVRAAAALAVQLLDDQQVSQTDRIQQVRALLLKVLTESTTLPPEARAALDADPTMQAAVARIVADEEHYVVAGPDGRPSDEPFARDPAAQALDDEALRKLGF